MATTQQSSTKVKTQGNQGKTAGLNVKVPENSCDDKKCPFHGTRTVHGMKFVGKVIRAKTPRNVLVEWERQMYLPKYERYERRYTRVIAHNPPCINAKEGDIVTLIETRPISKTKHFIVIEIGGAKHAGY